MQTRDHKLLGLFLLERYGAEISPLCRRMFLLGSVEPDWNLVTYIRGSVRYQFLHGHNAENAKKHLTRLTEKLMESGVRTPAQWFRFGAALHYLADSFTFAHNNVFAGDLLEHRLYEKFLHDVFAGYLKAHKEERFPAGEVCHDRYLDERRSYQTDCRYILAAAVALCDKLRIDWSADRAREYRYA